MRYDEIRAAHSIGKLCYLAAKDYKYSLIDDFCICSEAFSVVSCFGSVIVFTHVTHFIRTLRHLAERGKIKLGVSKKGGGGNVHKQR